MMVTAARARVWALLTPMLLLACGDDATAPELEVIEDVVFDASLDIDLASMTKTATGLYYQDLVVGEGEDARTGDLVDVAYTGWLRTGAIFDSGTFDFVIDSGSAVPGFNEGVRGMQVGGKRKLVIPPGLAYGAAAVGSIPAGSVLVFEVELLSVS